MRIRTAACLVLLLSGPAWAEVNSAPFANMAPIEQYRMNRDAEIALAKSAAPPSVSDQADVMVLGDKGYVIAVKGSNGFTCLVQRGWAAGFDEKEFWNPKVRAPMCDNQAGLKSHQARYFDRTRWVLGGASKAELVTRTKAAFAAHQYPQPESGAMCFMMSKNGHLSDEGGHWHPHLMFFVAEGTAAQWGANQAGTGIFAAHDDPDPLTTYFVPVPKWSDGTPDMAMSH
jgi:hypothetical protein